MWALAITCPCLWGMTTSTVFPVRTSSPPMISGISRVSLAMESTVAARLARSGLPWA